MVSSTGYLYIYNIAIYDFDIPQTNIAASHILNQEMHGMMSIVNIGNPIVTYVNGEV